MKTLFGLALAGLLTAAAPAAAQAPAVAPQGTDWPSRAVRILVPFGAGSTPDIVARLLAEALQSKLGQNFVVENKAGAGGNTGTDAVAKAEPDGYTIGISIGGPLAINTMLFSKLPYDPAKEITPVSQLITQPSILAVNEALGVKSVAELVALLKARPEALNFGSIGNGSLSHLAMEAIAQKSGARLVHVPYASSPQAVTALIRNDVQMGCLPGISVASQAGSQPIRMLAVSTAQRSPFLKDVPTLKESGIDVEADAWMGMIAPAGVPDAIIRKLNAAVVEAIRSPAIREKLAIQLMEPVGSSPEEFRARIAAEITLWAPVIKAANIKIN